MDRDRLFLWTSMIVIKILIPNIVIVMVVHVVKKIGKLISELKHRFKKKSPSYWSCHSANRIAGSLWAISDLTKRNRSFVPYRLKYKVKNVSKSGKWTNVNLLQINSDATACTERSLSLILSFLVFSSLKNRSLTHTWADIEYQYIENICATNVQVWVTLTTNCSTLFFLLHAHAQARIEICPLFYQFRCAISCLSNRFRIHRSQNECVFGGRLVCNLLMLSIKDVQIDNRSP